jgi:hypothetical protein
MRDVNAMKTHLRSDLDRRGIDHDHLTDIEAFHLSCALRGWHVTPRTAAGAGPIDARVWLAAALSTGGRYTAPETPGHPADLRDGGPEIDSVILMAVVQRHFVPLPDHAWDDDSLGDQLGLHPADVARAQAVLDEAQSVLGRAEAPLGAAWWTRAASMWRV